jgi:UDP:flavonoid glycosyltransferase YjiC (YdhE family)
LAAGVPQLVLSRHIEQDLNGEALERAGVARLIKPHQQGTHLEPGLISSLVADEIMAAQAETIGSHLLGFMARHDALDHCEAVCMDLLR